MPWLLVWLTSNFTWYMLVATQKEYLNPFQMSEEVMIHQGTDDVIMVKLSLNLS